MGIDRWASVALFLGALAAAGYAVPGCRQGSDQAAGDSSATTAPSSEEEKPDPGHVKLKPEEAERAGLKTEAVKPGSLQPEIRLFGVLQEDPGASFVVRAPAAGTVEVAEGKEWPRIGQTLTDGLSLGVLRPRPMPSDQLTIASQRVTLETQMAAARAELETATASLEAARKAYERQNALNEKDKGVSDRVVEEAALKVKTEEARVRGAEQTLQLATAGLPAQAQLAPMPMTVAHGGQVTEVSAHPGESVESGQAVLRVVRLDQLVAAIDVPAGEVAPSGREVRIVPLGNTTKRLIGTFTGSAAPPDPKTRGRVLLYRVGLGNSALPPTPGTPVTAYISADGAPLKGVTVPEGAVVRYLGKAWVYVAGADNEFERREVLLDHPAGGGDDWFVVAGFEGNERLVTVGAQVLLSSEINAAFGGGE
jgi:hypothetical protein